MSVYLNWKALNKVDSELYKGIAILMIVTHNFMHLFPSPKENEFGFNPDRFLNLINLLLDEPENSVRVLLSFLGHFGVQIFIFLSAYGLTKKYSKQKLNYWPFIWERIIKIYPAFILAIITWAIITGWILGGFDLLNPLRVMYGNLESLILKLLLLSNFIPSEYLSPVGPWWFIPFIFQFYFVFPFLLKLSSRWGGKMLITISIMSILFAIFVQGKIGNANIYYTILGHLPEFCLGIYLARNDENILRIPLVVILLAFVTFLLGNMYEIFWYCNHISFLIVLLAAFTYINSRIKGYAIGYKILLFFGAISMPLFLVNGFLRHPFISWAIDKDNWLLTIALCLLFILVCVVVALALSIIERFLMTKINQVKTVT